MPHIAAGGPKPLWEKVAYPDGTTENRPAGSQAEQSEVMNTIQDLSAHYGFDPRWLTGKKTLDFYKILWEHATGKRKPPAWFMRLRPHRVTHNPWGDLCVVVVRSVVSALVVLSVVAVVFGLRAFSGSVIGSDRVV